ncbi:MAG: hypothetical protein ACYTBJ_25975 [Planctomycetota bacterium]|jgi:hypothetical protein
MVGTTDTKLYSLLVSGVAALCLGCSTGTDEDSSAGKAVVSKSSRDVRTLTLQYRISMDAVAPSKFVAVYEEGMTLGLKIRWKLDAAQKQELDALIARLEAEKINGQEFIARGRWIHEGLELEVYDIEKKAGAAARGANGPE